MHSVTGKLNKAAQQFQAGESTGFGIGIGVKYKDPKTKVDEWTNYRAVIFAKSPNQIQFYQNVLAEGSVVTIGAEQLKIDVYEGQNGQRLSIDMLNARLTYALNPNQQPAPQQSQGNYQQPAQQPAPQSYQQPAQQPQSYQQPQQAQQQRPAQQAQRPAPQQAPSMDQFDDDIPFN